MPFPEPDAPAPAPADRPTQLLAMAGEHERSGRLDQARSLLGLILDEAPDRADALHQLGIVAFRQDRIDEATALMERSIALMPDIATYHRNLCEVYRARGQLDAALDVGRRAIELAPDDLHGHHNLSVLHYDRRELDQAIATAERALAIDAEFPGAHFGIAEASLLRGDFARGWAEYEWRFRLANAPKLMPPSDRPQWDGTPLAPGERLLLIADQGYGDVIQFARYIPWAASRCPDIAIACSGELHAVVGQQQGVGALFDHWDRCPAFAAFCALSSLPRLAGTTIATIPAAIPYLVADKGKCTAWAERLRRLVPQGYRRIGIVWAGRPTHHNDRRRSLPLASLAPLAAIPGIALVSLQKPPGQAQVSGYWGPAPLINVGPEIVDYADTMAIVESLELVVTVDTSVAHLAGAMGKPVWIMLPDAPDWRWLLDRTDTPWYPTARLFRQGADRQWPPVIARIAEELARTA